MWNDGPWTLIPRSPLGWRPGWGGEEDDGDKTRTPPHPRQILLCHRSLDPELQSVQPGRLQGCPGVGTGRKPTAMELRCSEECLAEDAFTLAGFSAAFDTWRRPRPALNLVSCPLGPGTRHPWFSPWARPLSGLVLPTGPLGPEDGSQPRRLEPSWQQMASDSLLSSLLTFPELWDQSSVPTQLSLWMTYRRYTLHTSNLT